MRAVRHIAILMTTALSLTGCGNAALRLISGGSSNVEGMKAGADGSSFSSRCGAKATDLTNPEHVILSQSMTGLPISMSGSSGGIAFTITLVPSVTVLARGGSSISETVVRVTDVVADDDGRFSRPKAERQARESSNRRTSTSMSSGLLMDLQDKDPNFKTIECAISFEGMARVETVFGAGTIKFTPGLPTTLNPLAPASTYESELGTSKTFTVTAKIVDALPTWAAKDTTADITVTVTRVNPDLPSTTGAPDGAPAIQADVAYEFAYSSSAAKLSQLGISKRRVVFINTSTHELVAILDDQGRVDSTTGKEIPPAVVIKNSN